jgi:hypothetical protein
MCTYLLSRLYKNQELRFFFALDNKDSSSSIGTTTLSWVLAFSTVVEHSQQEGFTECRYQRHVKTPTWRRTRDLESSNFLHKGPERLKRR